MTASTAATNGWRFAASVARAGADAVDRAEPEDVRENERAERREHESSPDLRSRGPSPGRVVCGRPTSASSTQASGITIALMRDGEYVRMSGAIDDRVRGPGRGDADPEQDPRVARPRPRRPRRPRRAPTPANEIAAASQNRRVGRSVPSDEPEERGEDRDRAEEQRRPSTPSSDRARRRSTAGSARGSPPRDRAPGACRRSMRSVRSTASVSATKIDRRAAVAHGRVRERQEAVREDVLRDAEVERPEQDHRQQHQLHGRRPAHASTLSRAAEERAVKLLRRCAGSRAQIFPKTHAQTLVDDERLGIVSLGRQRTHEKPVSALAIRREPDEVTPRAQGGVSARSGRARGSTRRCTRARVARPPRARARSSSIHCALSPGKNWRRTMWSATRPGPQTSAQAPRATAASAR